MALEEAGKGQNGSGTLFGQRVKKHLGRSTNPNETVTQPQSNLRVALGKSRTCKAEKVSEVRRQFNQEVHTSTMNEFASQSLI